MYTRRAPLDRDEFDKFGCAFPANIIRCKGVIWFENEPETSYIFEQSGKQVQAYEAGQWVASFPEAQISMILKENPEIRNDWDEKYGDRIVKLVFIGQKMDKEKIISDLDKCLVKE